MPREFDQVEARLVGTYSLTGDEKALLDAVRDVVREKVAPHAAVVDRDGTLPREQLGALRALDLDFAFLPAPYGAGLSFSCYLLVLEEIAYACGSTAISWAGNFHAITPLREYGTTDQKDRYLTLLTKGGNAALAVTEHHGGTDVSGMSTQLRRVGDEIEINGSKQFITNGSFADFTVVFGFFPEVAEGMAGLTAILVDNDAPGFRIVGVEEKMGLRGSQTATLSFDQCRVAGSNILGEPGQGRELLFRTLNWSRPSVGAHALGIAEAAFDQMIDYANLRKIKGCAQIDIESVHPMVADCATRLAQARLWMSHVAGLVDCGAKDFGVEASILKLIASELAVDATGAAVQLRGGSGFMRGEIVERLYRDARVTTIWEGASELHRRRIARSLRGTH